MIRHCLMCLGKRRESDVGAGDYCRRCRLEIAVEDQLDANWRLRAVNWFRHGCGHQGWRIRELQHGGAR